MGAEAWSAIANLVMAGAAMGGAVAAFQGLGTWKRQIRWHSDHDLARRLMISIYHFRDAIGAARSPFIWADELRKGDDSQETFHQSPEERHEGLNRAHRRRWEPIAKHSSGIYALLLEAEAMWGRDLKERWQNVRKLQNELLAEIELYLEAEHPRNSTSQDYYPTREAKVAAKLIIYSNQVGSEENDFTKRFEKAFSQIESFLRDKMGQKNL